jgi:hypothetical protein
MHIPAGAMEFNDRFDSEDACLAFLEELRWPNGFICPNCQHDDGYRIQTRPLIQCALCRKQTSVTAGTVFHKTHLPLRVWFYIIYSMAQDKGGASSSRLGAELQLPQKTVWYVMQKLRHAMGRRDELITLAGFIEMDEAVIGPHARRPTTAKKPGKQPRRRSWGLLPKTGERKLCTSVLVLVEQEPHRAGNVAMKVLDSAAARDIKEFVVERVDEFQHIKTDGFHAHHTVLRSFPCTYEAVTCSGPDGCVELPVVHRTISLLKTFLMGTYFGVAPKYLQLYLNEYAFRFNRRYTKRPLWLSLLLASIFGLPLTHAELIS